MPDEPSAAELSPEETYRSIGRYVYEFSQLVAHMRASITRHLDARPAVVAEIAFAQSTPDQIATAFFDICQTVVRLDPAAQKTAARLRLRVGEAIEMRANVAHGDWWVGSSVLGAEAVKRSARDLDARSDSLVALTNLVAEYGALCLRQPPYDRGEHRVDDYIVMRAGEAVREGPKALASRHVFYAPPPRGELAEAPAPPAVPLQQAVAQAAPEPIVGEPEPEPPPEVEPPLDGIGPADAAAADAVDGATPAPALLAGDAAGPARPSRRTRAAARAGALRDSLRSARPPADTRPAAQALLSGGQLPGWLTHRRLRRGMLALAAVTAVLLAVGVYESNVFGPLEQSTLGTRFSIRGAQTPPSDIVIVAIDNQSVDDPPLPPWPFPRRYEANVINLIHDAGAKAIGVDIQFTTATDATDDDDLISAVKQARGIVLSTSDVGSSGYTNVFGYSGPTLRRLYGAYAANAYVSPDPAAELTTIAYSENHLQTFAVRLAEQATHRALPDSGYPALVDYAGPPYTTFATRSFVDVCTKALKGCQGKVPPSFFKGKIVLIGATAAAIHDVHATPVGPQMSGVEYWANALWSILRGNPLRYASGALDVLIIVLMALAMPLLVLWLRPGLVLIAIAIAIGAVYAVCAQLAFDGDTVLSVVYPLVALVLGTVEATAADLWAERISRRQLEVYKVAYEALPSTASAAFFISYRREQSSWPARILRDELVRRFGEDQVFKDNDSIDAGQEWPQRLEHAIRDASVVLVLIGQQWADARGHDGERRLENPEDWVRLEVEAALAHTEAAVVPVLVDGASMPAPEALPETLRPLADHQAFVLSLERWDADLEALIDSIHSGRIRDFLARERAAGAGDG